MSNMPQVSNDKLMGILSYISVLVLIPILTKPSSDFVRFHANQGLVLLIIELASIVVSLIPIIGLISVLINIGTLVLSVIGILNVCNDQMKPLPVIGGIQLLK